MRMQPVASLAVLTIVLLAPSAAQAKINSGESLDWLTVSRPHVAIARVRAVSGEARGNAIWFQRTVELEVFMTLKGEPPRRVRLKRSVTVDSSPPPVGEEFLVFVDSKGQIAVAVDLDHPQKIGPDVAFGQDFSVLDSRHAILDAVERRLKRDPPKVTPKADAPSVLLEQWGFLRLDVPFDTPAHRALFAGSICYLIVPADPEYRDGLLERARSTDPWERAAAANHLANYPDDDVVNLLRGLLSDPDSKPITVHRGGKAEKHTVYPARQAAFEALRAMGMEVERPEGWSEHLSRSFN